MHHPNGFYAALAKRRNEEKKEIPPLLFRNTREDEKANPPPTARQSLITPRVSSVVQEKARAYPQAKLARTQSRRPSITSEPELSTLEKEKN